MSSLIEVTHKFIHYLENLDIYFSNYNKPFIAQIKRMGGFHFVTIIKQDNDIFVVADPTFSHCVGIKKERFAKTFMGYILARMEV